MPEHIRLVGGPRDGEELCMDGLGMELLVRTSIRSPISYEIDPIPKIRTCVYRRTKQFKFEGWR